MFAEERSERSAVSPDTEVSQGSEPAPDEGRSTGTQASVSPPVSSTDDESVLLRDELPIIAEEVEKVPADGILAPLPDGTELENAAGEGYRVVRQREEGYGYNLYVGERIGAEDAPQVWLWEEAASGGRLGREAELLQVTTLSASPLFLEWRESMEHDGRVYMVTEAGPERSLQDMIGRGLGFVQAISILARVAAGLAQLNEAGWVHAAVRPSRILVGDHVKVIGLAQTVRINEQASTPRSYPGYSAPEVAGGKSLDAQTDVYGLGAILYEVTAGARIPEEGVELTTGLPSGLPAGVPQILHRCLGPREGRFGNLRVLHRELAKLLRRSRPTLAFEVAGASIIGLNPDRTTNEDAYGYLQGQTMCDDGLRNWGVFCLADGMGGMDAGEVASRTAVQVVLAQASDRFGSGNSSAEVEQAEWPAEWIQAANTSVCDVMARHHAHGGTTVVVVVAVNETVTIGHVGDSRLYCIRGNQMELLTRDHSLAMTHVIQGDITEEEVRSHPDRNRLTRSVGAQSPLPPYHIDTLEIKTGRKDLLLAPDDVLILCSDGVWELMEDPELAESVTGGQPLSKAAQELLALVLERGAPDNATVLLVRVVEAGVAGTGNRTPSNQEQ